MEQGQSQPYKIPGPFPETQAPFVNLKYIYVQVVELNVRNTILLVAQTPRDSTEIHIPEHEIGQKMQIHYLV